MAVSDVEVWVDSNGDQTCDLKLTRPWGVTYNRRKHLDGEASFMVTNDDPQVVANLILKRRRMAIVHTATGLVLYSGRISSYSYVEVDAGEHAGMNTQFGVRDDLADLRRRPRHSLGVLQQRLPQRPLVASDRLRAPHGMA
jgi:hypothetical protein